MPGRKGIVRKTFLFSSLLIVLVVLLSFSVLYFVMPGYYLRQKEQTLLISLNSLTAELKTAETREDCVSLISDFIERNNADVTAFDAEGMLLAEMSSPFVSMQGEEKNNGFYVIYSAQDSEPAKGQLVITIRQKAFGEIPGDSEQQPDSGKQLVGIYEQNAVTYGTEQSGKTKMFARTLQKDSVISMRGDVGTGLIDYVVATGNLQPIGEARGVILSLIPYVLLVAVAVGMIMSWLYARQISKPILRISNAAVKMRDMEPDALSGIRTGDELGQLSQNLDDLYAKLRENIESLEDEMERVNLLERSKTEMMQSASHELKTPVAALAGMLDGMIDNVGAYKDRDKYLAECKGQVEKLSWLVREILEASRADHPSREPAAEETAVNLLLEQALEEYAAITAERGLTVVKNLSPVTVITDPAMLYRALANLISNAARYTADGGEIRVTLSERILSIENQSEQIPVDELEKLFEPFYTRSQSRDKSRSGTGLGLYIVKRNLERLGIPYEMTNTQDGIKISLSI